MQASCCCKTPGCYERGEMLALWPTCDCIMVCVQLSVNQLLQRAKKEQPLERKRRAREVEDQRAMKVARRPQAQAQSPSPERPPITVCRKLRAGNGHHHQKLKRLYCVMSNLGWCTFCFADHYPTQKCFLSELVSIAVFLQNVFVDKGQCVLLKELSGYASTYYHIPHSVVEKDTSSTVSNTCVHHVLLLVLSNGKMGRQPLSVV